MKTFSCLAFGLCFGALAACGDDDGSGGSGGATTSTTTSTSTGTSSASTTATGTTTTATASGSTSASTSASSGSTGTGGGGMTGCEENPQECVTNQMDCACAGSCAICNDIECFDYELEVECINGFAGITCTCTVDGQFAGNCDQNQLSCELETNCCFQFLMP